MVEGKDDEARRARQQRHDLSRTVHYYGLLIGVIGCVNVWIYWANGSIPTLVLAIVCFVALVGWLVYARTVLRKVGRS
jgi:hypothetical protein